MDAEVLQVAESTLNLRAAAADRAALYRVENLGRMEAEHRGISETGGAHAIAEHTEAVGCVIDHRQAVPGRDLSDPVHIAKVSVNMDRQDGDRLFGDQRLQLLRIQGIGFRVNVTEHRAAAAAHDGMGRGSEGKRCRDDLTVKMEGLDHVLQGQMSVGEKGNLFTAQKPLQLLFQLLVLAAHVGEPVAVPEFTDFLTVFFKGRHGRPCHIDRHVPFSFHGFRQSRTALMIKVISSAP